MIRNIFAVCSLLSAVPAFAGWYTCSTESHARIFTYSDDNEYMARDLAVGNCKRDSSTKNSECESRLGCVYAGQYNPIYTCETESHGGLFSGVHEVYTVAQFYAVDICKGNSSTSNSECESRVLCDTYGPNVAPYQCEAVSNGHLFRGAARTAQNASYMAIDNCRAHPSTNNGECERQVACNGSYAPPSPPFPPSPPSPPVPPYELRCTTTTSGNMPYTGYSPQESINSCVAGEQARPQGRPWDCDPQHTICVRR